MYHAIIVYMRRKRVHKTSPRETFRDNIKFGIHPTIQHNNTTNNHVPFKRFFPPKLFYFPRFKWKLGHIDHALSTNVGVVLCLHSWVAGINLSDYSEYQQRVFNSKIYIEKYEFFSLFVAFSLSVIFGCDVGTVYCTKSVIYYVVWIRLGEKLKLFHISI